MSFNPVKIPPNRSMATYRFKSWDSIKYRPTLPDTKRNTDINVKYKNNRLILNLIDSKWMLLYIKTLKLYLTFLFVKQYIFNKFGFILINFIHEVHQNNNSKK